MACDLLERCSFYKNHKNGESRGWEFLLSGYCEGQYTWLCCRRRYFDRTGALAPGDVHPVGVLPSNLVAAPEFICAGSLRDR